MKELAIKEKSKDFFRKVIFNFKYGRKFRKLGIDNSFSEVLIDRNGEQEKAIFEIIKKSRTQKDFENNIKEYFKANDRNVYASALLLGNITGKYVFNAFYFDSTKGLNIDAFSRDNQDLVTLLKEHFSEYVINNNRLKNSFAKRIKVEKIGIKDLTKDLNEDELTETFQKILDGEQVDNIYSQASLIAKYLMETIGTYSREDIKDNFDFILYDINSGDTRSLEERRNRYLSYSKLTDDELRKIDEYSTLKTRLQSISGPESEQLLSRLAKIEGSLYENIDELDSIYGDYEVLYRQDLLDSLYVPSEDVTIIEDYRDIKPQLLHRFIRSADKFREMEIEKAKAKIISERRDGNKSEELTLEEQERLNKMIGQIDVNLDQYKVNYTTDGKGMVYTDTIGIEPYYSDTTNQISASIFEGEELISPASIGIIGIGFNSETVTPEAIAISSKSYKTTNKGLNNIEYNEADEFEEMSAPFSELIKAYGKSEIIMHRRGMDFDTKASYIFAKIDSSNQEQTSKIMKQLEEVRKKEGLKVVIYDIFKIKESMRESKENESESSR